MFCSYLRTFRRAGYNISRPKLSLDSSWRSTARPSCNSLELLAVVVATRRRTISDHATDVRYALRRGEYTMTTARNTHEDQQSLWQSPEAAQAWRRNAATRMRLLGPATERMLVLANIGEGCHVLDIAAGTGDQTILAAQRVGPGGRVVATDISSDMLAIAAEQARQAGLTNVTTQVLDAQHLDFPAETFDAVISRQGLRSEERRV